ncbi:MAG: PepSY domain-containing protein [Hyphomonas sp.]|nr:PepSY domain-containing protein [Hyphomonas sp.]
MRRIIFWIHFVCGLATGIAILIMSVTGVLLTYERQMLESARAGSVQPADGAVALTADEVVAAAISAGAGPGATITLTREARLPVVVSKGRRDSLLLDSYTGAPVEDAAAGANTFFSRITAIHRWLAFTGTRTEAGAAVMGVSNLVFGLLLLTGAVLWWPKMWKWAFVKTQLFFRRGLPNAKARHYNWHHVLAAWAAVPLAAIILSGAVFSYAWANRLVYAAFGEVPPQRGAAASPGDGPAESLAPPSEITTYAEAVARAVDTEPHWRRVILTLPAPAAPHIAVTVDRGNGAQASARTALLVSRDAARPGVTVAVDASTPAGRARRFVRFLHTGEVYGWIGQTIAGLASLAAVVLVYTGLSLGIRRLVRMRRTSR